MLEGIIILLGLLYVAGAVLTGTQKADKYQWGWDWPLRAWRKLRSK